MLSSSHYIIYVILAITLWIVYVRLTRKHKRVVYLDTNKRSRVFRSDDYLISSKPDRLEKTSYNHYILTEYKSRKDRVYESDIKQTIASVIAVRGEGIPVRQAFVQTGNGQSHPIDVDQSTAALFKIIKDTYKEASAIQRGHIPKPKPCLQKCRSCGYKQHCSHRAF